MPEHEKRMAILPRAVLVPLLLLLPLTSLTWAAMADAPSGIGQGHDSPVAAMSDDDLFALPPHRVESSGEWEWQVWYSGFGTRMEQAHGRLYHGGEEITGIPPTGEVECDLGKFVWKGSRAQSAWLGGHTGWMPADGRNAASLNRAGWRAIEVLTRSEPDFLLKEGDDLWMQWRYDDYPGLGKKGLHGALRVDGKWIVQTRPDSTVDCGLGHFVPAGADGVGWLSANPSSRKTLPEIMMNRRVEQKELAAELAGAIAAGANVHKRYPGAGTPLMLAASRLDSLWSWLPPEYPDPMTVEILLAAGARPNERNEEGYTALHLAVEGNSNPRVTDALIKAGAEVNVRNNYGMTPLLSAVENQVDPVFVMLLLDAGAEVDASRDGDTPLQYAFRYNGNPRIALLLASAGASVEVVDREGKDIRELAREYRLAELAEQVIALATQSSVQGTSAFPSGNAEELLRGVRYGYSGDREAKPFRLRHRPSVLLSGENAEWRLWTPSSGETESGMTGRLYMDGKEVAGKVGGERFFCELGEFEWRGRLDERTYAWQDSGWFPVLEPMRFHREVRRWLTETARRYDGMSLSMYKAEGDSIWTQWTDGEGRVYGELALDGEWLGRTDRTTIASPFAHPRWDFVWHGGDVMGERSGWLSANPLLRYNLGQHIVDIGTPVEIIDSLLRCGANPVMAFPPRLDSLPEGARIDPYHAALLKQGATAVTVDALALALMHRPEPALVRLLLDRAAQDEEKGLSEPLSCPPILIAAWYVRDPETMRMMISFAANFPDPWTTFSLDGGETIESPLQWAATAGNLEMVRALLIARRLF